MTDNPRADLRDKVRRFIEENALLTKGERVVVALSGGADSVCLLHVLISLRELIGIDVFAAHFHHGIRGAEADRDEAFVKELCDRFGISLFLDHADVPGVAAQTGESIELCGRRLRYDFLERGAASINGAKIATAHHRGDNAETVLWNLTRGAGIDGLSGIPAKRGNIIRPLLSCSRAEIEAYCGSNGLDYMTDSTNLSDDYTRNKLRRRVMPVLHELNAGAEENIARTASLMREADDYLNDISLSELNNTKTDFGYSCGQLLQLRPIVLKYAVKNLLEQAGATVDSRHIELIIDKMRDGGAVSLGRGMTAVCAQGILRITNVETTAESDLPSLTEFLHTNGVLLRVCDGKATAPDGSEPLTGSDGKINNLLLHNCIPCGIITSDTQLRRRRPGDTFSDGRRGVTKTLKKLMNERKIPRERRDDYLVIANGSTVLWLQGCGTSAQATADLTRDGDIILLMGDS